MDANHSSPTKEEKNSAAFNILHWWFETYCRIVLRFWCRIKAYRIDNLPPSPYILCANHGSHMDTPVLIIASGKRFNQYAMIAARDYFFDANSGKQRWYQKLMFLIPVERAASRQSLQILQDASRPHIAAKRNIIIYPEGTRSRDGTIGHMKRGAAHLALMLQLPVVPVYIDGTFLSMPRGTLFPKKKTLSVVFGKPIMLSATTAPNSRELAGTIEEEIHTLRNQFYSEQQ